MLGTIKAILGCKAPLDTMAKKGIKADASPAIAVPAAGEAPLTDAEKASPVLQAMGKRLRAARKKLNRITQLEQQKADGKELNADQVCLDCNRT